MELSTRTAADPSTAHIILPRSKSIITTRTKNKNGLRMIKSGETTVIPIPLRRPQLPPVTITPVERNIGEQESSSGRPSDVLRILDALRLPVDADTYSALIKECIDSRDAVEGASIHAHIQRWTRSSTRNSSGHLIQAGRLLLMYAACGRLRDARQLFDEMPMKDAISRLTMISALSDSGDHVEAIKLFVDMHENGCAGGGDHSHHLFDAAIAILRSCVRAEDLQVGRQVHGLTLKLVGSAACADSLVVRLLVGLYSGCQHWTDKLMEWMPHNDAAKAWTSVINGHCEKGQFDRALLAFGEMRRLVGNRKKSCLHIHNSQGIFRACAMVRDEGRSGMQVHADAIKIGLDKDPTVGSNLVRMYGKYGRLDYARKAFNAISNSLRDAACWNAMLVSLLSHRGCSSPELLRFHLEMKAAGIEPQESILYEVLFSLV